MSQPLSFETELRILLNQHSKENDSNTPDFILAKYIAGCLATFSIAIRERDNWSGGWVLIADSTPNFPNGGEWLLVRDGTDIPQTAQFHRDEDDAPWWEDTYGNKVVGVTHWTKIKP